MSRESGSDQPGDYSVIINTAQKRAWKKQVEKIACLHSNGGQKIIWKPRKRIINNEMAVKERRQRPIFQNQQTKESSMKRRRPMGFLTIGEFKLVAGVMPRTLGRLPKWRGFALISTRPESGCLTSRGGISLYDWVLGTVDVSHERQLVTGFESTAGLAYAGLADYVLGR